MKMEKKTYRQKTTKKKAFLIMSNLKWRMRMSQRIKMNSKINLVSLMKLKMDSLMKTKRMKNKMILTKRNRRLKRN